MSNKIEIKGNFVRKPLGKLPEKIPVPVGWFVIGFNLMKDKNDRREYHGKWFTIKSDHKKIYRVLRFAPNIKGTSSNNNDKEILLDWVGWLDLNNRDEDIDEPIKLTITKTGRIKSIFAGLYHPEPSFRLSTVLALISVILGILSVVLALVL
ncbi:hypothetical protein D1164_04585 [Mariniphaga sediminis]|uniref:Uncharacterized protein n=1 Tax=Mariniphaga sediminis TaxID=1628158 RepID=A0A399D456_9BACT|nr:hypothetical protein [Mariniphaga sediminis]RIH66193.1 hypothetical protein D1164_04585 [Mariniphaga sediminis]